MASIPIEKAFDVGYVVNVEVRYARSFLQDLTALETDAYWRVDQIVFVKFPQINRLQELPEFRAVGSTGIFYRFTVDRYLIGLEMTGQIVKFMRILPKPHV